MISVPTLFQPREQKNPYPSYAIALNQEEYFYDYFCHQKPRHLSRVYLPIFWTRFYIQRQYGQADMSDLQGFLDKLDRSQKYFTIVQYDSGILQDTHGLDLITAGSGGGGINPGYQACPFRGQVADIVIPLLPNPPPTKQGIHQKYRISFRGNLKTDGGMWRYPLSQRDWGASAIISGQRKDAHEYLRELESSVFTLAPRGYGFTSYRLYEAIHLGVIPVYLWADYEFLPYQELIDWNDFALSVCLDHKEHVDILKDKIYSMSTEEIVQRRRAMARVRHMFTMDYVCRYVIQRVKS